MRLGFRRRGLRLGLLGLLVGSVMLTLLVGSSAAAPVCSGGTCTETFVFTGGAQTWTVPLGVTSAIRKPLTFRARPTSRTGVYRARVVFPSAGTCATRSLTPSRSTAALARTSSHR